VLSSIVSGKLPSGLCGYRVRRRQEFAGGTRVLAPSRTWLTDLIRNDAEEEGPALAGPCSTFVESASLSSARSRRRSEGSSCRLPAGASSYSRSVLSAKTSSPRPRMTSSVNSLIRSGCWRRRLLTPMFAASEPMELPAVAQRHPDRDLAPEVSAPSSARRAGRRDVVEARRPAASLHRRRGVRW